ncbi:DNA damage-inducible protein 1 [[Candida] railenensis]|uniref:DNA damage-inducible protein 1 n=1 Tax=[Candida] railenensis TaxID=45579 RepID=A0A9P0VX05_9ASCO|nr:DNA damage-inducible protein 1 [[Candida] railenensis]
MKITIFNETSGDTISVDLPGSLSLVDFQVYLEAETTVSPANQILLKDGSPIDVSQTDSGKTIEGLNLSENDLVILQDRSSTSASATASSSSGPSAGPSSSSNNGGSDPEDTKIEEMRNHIINNPQMNAQFQQQNPGLHALLHQPAKFKEALKQSIQQFNTSGGYNSHQQEELRRLQEDPDDPNNQARILELIQQEQIEENFRLAYEISPESFTSVNMLYINIVINGQTVQAFVDSGAQVTLMSPKLAERLGLSRLIDKRYIGEVRGVGSSMTKGKIHSVPISIGDSDIAIPCAFTVLDTAHDILFGLDMLRRHKCVIDLERDVLVVGGNIETKFLHESVVQHEGLGAAGNVLGGGAPGKVLGGGGNVSEQASSGSNKLGSSSSAPTSSSQSAQAAINRQSKFKKEDIDTLVNIGFPRDQAIQALEACSGNVEMAAAMLFQ